MYHAKNNECNYLCDYFTVFNLVNNVEVETTKKWVDQYKKENKEIIQKNRSKMVSYVIIIIILE